MKVKLCERAVELIEEIAEGKVENLEQARKELIDAIIESLQNADDEVIEEIRGRLLSRKEKMLLRRPTERRKLLQRCGKKAFLLPEELKFPIVSPLDEKCEPNCALIFAAYLRANEWKKKRPEYEKIAKKAKELFEKYKCAEKINVQIREDVEVSLGDFLEMIGV